MSDLLDRAEVLVTADVIQRRVAEIAADIRRDVGARVHLVGVLKGAFMFMSDLVRHLDGMVSLDFMAVSSYAEAPVVPAT
jgi:hypoxanthine-guanine phosphoribosyltransferase